MIQRFRRVAARPAARPVGLGAAVLIVAAATGSRPAAEAAARSPEGAPAPAAVSATPAAPAAARSASEVALVAVLDALDAAAPAAGKSGRLRATFVTPELLASLRGDAAVATGLDALGLETPGVRTLADPRDGRERTLITLVPFTEKVGKPSLEGYRIGFWPNEKRAATGRYALPAGFIRVTMENRDVKLSEHFRVRDFLTKDQQAAWPKFLVHRLELADKLELVIAELETMGHPVTNLHVMSGFRTPQYNAKGLGQGRATLSRHQYGDAADVYVDNDRDGQLDDLNRDGRVTTADARVIAEAAERVERKHPDLVGGVGTYPATSAHPPFVHIDVRGTRARWGV